MMWTDSATWLQRKAFKFQGKVLVVISNHHFSGAECLRGLYWPLKAGSADVNVLRVAVLRQEFQEGPDIQVVIIINMAEPPAEHVGDS